MKQQHNIFPFDNLLLAYILRQDADSFVAANTDKEAEQVLNARYDTVMAQEKVDRLLSSLMQALAKESLGTLVQKGLSEKTVSIEHLQSSTGLTSSLIEDIKSDMVFTNSIPVRSLTKLLKILGIPFQKALAAIQTTFEKLNTENQMFLSIPVKAQPAFRKGIVHGDSSFDVKRLRSDESYLYQNKEALDKYTGRLEQLYNEI